MVLSDSFLQSSETDIHQTLSCLHNPFKVVYVTNVLDCNIAESEFKLKSCH